ncbi:MAG: nitronate monooxygenase, partial [Alphaproteobacteria bacterium]|nr:nitronate monooxygenase [Alphaproteobacteria bacterium]
LAGGHNGLSNAEDPAQPQTPYMRLVELRKLMNSLGLDEKPIILAGGVWALEDWQDYIDNPDIGKIAFQFGTRPMITKESPISDAWKKLMLQVKKGDVILQKFSPTGFFSSAIKNSFLSRLMERKDGEVVFSTEANSEFSHELKINDTKSVFIKPEDVEKVNRQISAGYTEIKESPDNTVVFLTPNEWAQMKEDRKNCVGCLSQCQFSSWSQAKGSTGRLPDPRSYCIHKTLYDVSHNGSVVDNLLFAGHQVYRFATDPLYRNGIPSVKELIERIKSGK